MTGRIFSPGKLLLTAEYAVLDGALALAVPTKWGQEFFFEEIGDGNSTVFWEACHQDHLWLKTEIDYSVWRITETNFPEASQFVLKVLRTTAQLSSLKFKNNTSYRIKTNLQFPPDFGLGSSSTLMNNLAEWAGIDAFELNEKTLGGSGYDIAIAQEKSPVLFQRLAGRPLVTKVEFNPDFCDDLIFVHLNKKQDSREGISHYRSREISATEIDSFSELTRRAILCDNLDQFSELMEVHEQKMSNMLLIKTVKAEFFRDCPVFVKSLGAWGGDFVMSRKFDGYRAYFSERGFTQIFSWRELIL